MENDLVHENPYSEMAKKILGPLIQDFSKLEPDERVFATICLIGVLSQSIQELSDDLLAQGFAAVEKE